MTPLAFNAKFVWDLSDSLTMIQVPYPPGGQYWRLNTSLIPVEIGGAGASSHVAAGSQTCSPAYPGNATIIQFDFITDENAHWTNRRKIPDSAFGQHFTTLDLNS